MEQPTREHSLDILRSIAALSVVIAHTTIAGVYGGSEWYWLKWAPIRIFWAGHQAVILFFVLSGFALTSMLNSLQNITYKQYLSARIARLYPPYLASIIAAFLIYSALQYLNIEWEKGWLNVVKPLFNIGNLVQHALMIGTFDSSTINPPIWSIVYEMRISILFPIIFYFVIKFKKYTVIASIIFSITIAIIWIKFPYPQWGLLVT